MYSATHRELRFASSRVVLPLQESLVLEALLVRPAEVVSKQELAFILWPCRQHGDSDRAIHNLISKLRRMHPKAAGWIVTVPKAGYKFELPVSLENAPEPWSRNAPTRTEPPPLPALPPLGPYQQPDCALEATPNENGDRYVTSVNAVPTGLLATVRDADSMAPAWHGEQTASTGSQGIPVTDVSRKKWWQQFDLRSGPIIAAVTVLLLVVAAAALLLHHRMLARQAAAQVPVRLTILPFTDTGGSLGEVETLREQLADVIAAVPQIEVSASHTPQVPKPEGEVSPRYGELLLGGSFTANGATYSLNLELIRSRDNVHLSSWHYTGQRTSLGSLPDRIMPDLAPSLQRGPNMEVQRLLGSTTNEKAFDLAFRARTGLLQRSGPDVERAADLYRQAIALDPRFARAWSGLSECELVLANFGSGAGTDAAFEQARTAALHALAINPDEAQAHSTLGAILLQHDWQLKEAERHLRLAVAENSGNAANHLHLAILLADENRQEEAQAEIYRAEQADPQWIVVHGTAMYVHLMARRYREAIEDGRALVALKPDWSRAHQHLGWALWYAGHHKPAIKEWERSAELEHNPEGVRMQQEGLEILTHSGAGAYAEFRIARHAAGQREEDFVPAEWHAFAGDTEGTLRALQQMVSSRNPESLKIAVNPSYDFLRRNERFLALLAALPSR